MPRKRVVSRTYSKGYYNKVICIDITNETLEEYIIPSPILDNKQLSKFCKNYIEFFSKRLKFCYIKESKECQFYAEMPEEEYLAHSKFNLI